MSSHKKVFLIAGRTGGPVVPLLAIQKNLTGAEAIIIGVRKSFEEKAARELGYRIEFLPSAKLDVFSFYRFDHIFEILGYIPKTLINLWDIFWAFIKGFYLNWKHQPDMIISTGSFLAVPIIFSNLITQKLGRTNTKIVIHQQDPICGKANRLTARYGHLLTTSYDYSRTHYAEFKHASIIPNPVDISRFDDQELMRISSFIQQKNPELYTFLQEKNKPLLFVFGGGTGAKVINRWVWDNLSQLLEKFNVLHLTGAILEERKNISAKAGYLMLTALFEEMPLVMKKADVVFCRAGLSTITELLYLQKKAYLAPIPYHHQELNAEQVENSFIVLSQRNYGEKTWLESVLSTYPGAFSEKSFPIPDETQTVLQDYYQKVQSLLDKNPD